MNAQNPRECGARTVGGAPCKKKPMPNGRCRLHGGATPSGAALPQYKTGRYSKHLPDRLAARYHEALADAELLAVRDDVALLDVRLSELVNMLGGDAIPGIVWAEVRDLLEQRRKLVETEHRRLVAMQQMITTEQAMALLGAVLGVIRKHVSDPATLGAISADFAVLSLVQRPVGRPAAIVAGDADA